MKLNEPLKIKKQKLPFFSWILFDPKAFQVVFIMSMIMGLLISGLLVWISWTYWLTEIAIFISIMAAVNVYVTFGRLKYVKYNTLSINDLVYSGKYKPKKQKKGGK